jgi:hypothetical protein
MDEREVLPSEIEEALVRGEVIQAYPDDRPYPSYLLLAWVQEQPLHVVVGQDSKLGNCIIITVYKPSLFLWNEDYKTRR